MPLDVTEVFRDVLLKPSYGYGSAVNPCIDCRIFTLRRAREIMDAEGASFVFTGEVLGQRPMSQHRNALELVAKRSGLEGRLLRPLSARLMEPTIPEKEGIVNHSSLCGFSGRSRKPQQELAARWGIDWYPNSGGGCMLTDRNFAPRFRDLVAHSGGGDVSCRALMSLKTGRHFRLPGGTKIIVGRTESENDYVEALLGGDHWVFTARDFPGASVIAFDEPHEEEFPVIASICARYGKGASLDTAAVVAVKGLTSRIFDVTPAFQSDIDAYYIM